MENTVADTIIEQLGRSIRTISMMIGARDFVATDKGVMFRWAAKAKNGANKIIITLDPSDTYTVEFGRYRAGQYKPVSRHNDVYCDSLKPLFEAVTGLYLSLR